MDYTINDYETRYYAGIELIGGLKAESKDYDKLPDLWNDFRQVYLEDIPHKVVPNKFIGLEMYRFDFMESKTMDYFALVEITHLFDCDQEDVVTKKLPKGRYISFTINHDDLLDEVENVYEYIKQENINIHLGFDFKEYLNSENYQESGAKLCLSFKLEDDI
ncbi:MAG: GyrI-like domain-containing protein [Candidatus Izemoplasmatales bacterium]|nr:GyrI-like domain-containing protein [Candidatus Izemoplasmatales bacterium]MDD4069855.1 GyrI-like domain-containing protein [Candidatus Izemoplasmatales bacterium]MDY0139283.1 GyrI-like domain-containing protein [Candidatus Izemoplasmatales bacterium]